jgi:hypothetical protein
MYRKCHENSNLFVYCGHGGGERLLDKSSKYDLYSSMADIHCIMTFILIFNFYMQVKENTLPSSLIVGM